MSKTNWVDPGSSEITSPLVAGLQEAVGKLEDALNLSTTAETDVAMSEVYIATDRYRIYQVADGKRNWVASPAPVIKKNGVVISSGFTILYGGGAIVLSENALETDTFTASFTRTNTTSGALDDKEDAFSKNTGFNLNKSDAVDSDSSTTLATSKAVKTVNDALGTHEAKTASQETAGHVKVDNDTIKIDNGVISSGVKNNYTATTAPTKTDDSADGYAVGSEWINTNTNIMYKCTDAETGKAVWKSYSVSTRTDQEIYGVKIDTTNSNPKTALTYTDDAVGLTPATGNNGSFNYGSWADKFPFNQIKPCLFKNGAVNYYLDPDDYTKKEDGVTASDITSGTDGDVMVEFPQIWWKFNTIDDDLYVRYANMQVDDDYKCLAHLRGTTEKDKCYISAYLGYNLSSKLRSLSGKTPTASQTIGAFRTLAQANGTGYDQMAFFQLLMLQVLFIVMFKDRDSQTALGRGYVDGNSAAISTGGTNAKGMFYGETTGKLQNKFCGIEDFWGNLRYWIDGFWSDASRHILIANQSFNDTGSGYTDYGQGASDNLSGYISAVQGTTETGFVVKATAGSETTYYADNGYLYASRLPYCGGHWSNADNAGAFRLYANNDASYSNTTIGSRLLVL